jgi:hypothetical protein
MSRSIANKSVLIARPGYAGVGGFWDDLASSFSKGVVTQSQTATQADIQAAIAAQQGPGIGTYLLIGGGILAAVMILKKKKK